MDLNILSKYINNNDVITGKNSLDSNNENTNSTGNKCLHEAFSDELNTFRKNGFESKIDAYKNASTGTTTVAIGLSQEGLDENYVLVKNNWDDNKWNMTVLDNANKKSNSIYSKIENSLWLASRGLEKTIPNQFCIEGLTIEEILKLCE